MSTRFGVDGVPVESVKVSSYRVPTDAPESDGTYEWDSTTMVLVEVEADGETGLGYTYGDQAVGELIRDKLAGTIKGRDAMMIPSANAAMGSQVRNLGRSGVAFMAISAVDVALWDLKSRLLGTSVLALLGAAREEIDIYGSGGFTSYTIERLREQLGSWSAEGIPRVKMKVGRQPEKDLERARAVREVIGTGTELFVDANGAYGRKQALRFADEFDELGVTYFEEPVSSDDLEGLHLLRDRAPAGMSIAAGEYGYDLFYFRRILDAGAVDILQADVTRCGGFTGFLEVSALCQARPLALSAHCAPTLSMHVCCAALPAVHIEYFHDHHRIEHMFFDGAPSPVGGKLRPDPSRPGLGLEFKRSDARRYAV